MRFLVCSAQLWTLWTFSSHKGWIAGHVCVCRGKQAQKALDEVGGFGVLPLWRGRSLLLPLLWLILAVRCGACVFPLNFSGKGFETQKKGFVGMSEIVSAFIWSLYQSTWLVVTSNSITDIWLASLERAVNLAARRMPLVIPSVSF